MDVIRGLLLNAFGTGFVSVFSAVMVTMIAVGIQHPSSGREATVKTDVYHAFLAVCNIVFSFCE